MSDLKPYDPTMPRIGNDGTDAPTRRENIEAINSNEFGAQLSISLWGTAPGWSCLDETENPNMYDNDGRLSVVISKYSDGLQAQKIEITYNDVGTGSGQVDEHLFYYSRDNGATWVFRAALKSYYDANGNLTPKTTWRYE